MFFVIHSKKGAILLSARTHLDAIFVDQESVEGGPALALEDKMLRFPGRNVVAAAETTNPPVRVRGVADSGVVPHAPRVPSPLSLLERREK